MKGYCMATFFLSFFFSAFFVQAQKVVNDTRNIKVLIFENQRRGITKMISQGALIKYKLNNNKQVKKGILTDVKEGIMVINNEEIAFEDCAMIAGRVSSQQQILGGMALGAGAVSLVFSSALLGLGTGATLVTLGGAVIVITIGIVIIMQKKHFNLNKKWEVHSGELAYSLLR